MARSGVLAHIEKRHALPELHVDFARRETTVQPSGLFTRARL